MPTRPVAERPVWAEIDREARKGKPTPSDHAPVVVDLDAPGVAFDAGGQSAAERFEKARQEVTVRPWPPASPGWP